jgi:hypothetical protein
MATVQEIHELARDGDRDGLGEETLVTLRSACQQLGIRVLARMTKTDLIEALIATYASERRRGTTANYVRDGFVVDDDESMSEDTTTDEEDEEDEEEDTSSDDDIPVRVPG